MMRGSPMLARRWVRIAPHLIDTLLLLSGVTLVVHYRIYPTEQAWLAAKLLALVVYIVVGSIALKRGKTRAVRVTAFFAALIVFAYMLAVANTRLAMPFV